MRVLSIFLKDGRKVTFYGVYNFIFLVDEFFILTDDQDFVYPLKDIATFSFGG